MKKTVIALTILVFLTLAGGFATRRFMIGYVRKNILPDIANRLRTNVILGRCDPCLINRSISLSKLMIGNPPGFNEPDSFGFETAKIKLALLPMLKKTVELRDLRADGLKIYIIRNSEGVFNFNAFKSKSVSNNHHASITPEAGHSTQPTNKARAVGFNESYRTGTPDNGNHSEPQSADTWTIAVKQSRLQGTVKWIDHTVNRKFAPPAFDLDILGTNVVWSSGSVATGSTARHGILAISGHLHGAPDECVVDLDAVFDPVYGGRCDNFRISGTIRAIDVNKLTPLSKKWDIQFSSADVEIRVRCENGLFVRADSLLKLILKDVKLQGKLADKVRKYPLPRNLKLSVPVTGSVNAPQIDVGAAIMNAVMQNLGGMLGTMLRNTTINGKPLINNPDAVKALGGLFKSFHKNRP